MTLSTPFNPLLQSHPLSPSLQTSLLRFGNQGLPPETLTVSTPQPSEADLIRSLIGSIQERFSQDSTLRLSHECSERQPETYSAFLLNLPEGSNLPKASPRFQPERESLHQEIIQQVWEPYLKALQIHPPLFPRQAHIVTGLPGSGKSTQVVSRLAQEIPSAFVLDMDELAKGIPEYQVNNPPVCLTAWAGKNGLGAQAVHKEAQYLARTIFNRLIEGNHSLMMSYVGEKTQAELSMIRLLKSKGYDVFLHHVSVPPQVAIDRIINRFQTTGRYVSPYYVAKLGNQSTQAYEELVQLAQPEGLLKQSYRLNSLDGAS
ncbi:MAG: zeta toxin family protein [Cyanobacteria bacterium]|nr:zeta toxin family protein [Cyanobacteriota bacterium]